MNSLVSFKKKLEKDMNYLAAFAPALHEVTPEEEKTALYQSRVMDVMVSYGRWHRFVQAYSKTEGSSDSVLVEKEVVDIRNVLESTKPFIKKAQVAKHLTFDGLSERLDGIFDGVLQLEQSVESGEADSQDAIQRCAAFMQEADRYLSVASALADINDDPTNQRAIIRLREKAVRVGQKAGYGNTSLGSTSVFLEVVRACEVGLSLRFYDSWGKFLWRSFICPESYVDAD